MTKKYPIVKDIRDVEISSTIFVIGSNSCPVKPFFGRKSSDEKC